MREAGGTILLESVAPGCLEMETRCDLGGRSAVPLAQKGVKHYPRRTLQPLGRCAGVRHWGVAIDDAVLTYFEVDPNTRFHLHRHDSEQITLVLEGTLFFEIDGALTAVGAGEVVAIPSRVPHALFTGESLARVVDVWSPTADQSVATPGEAAGGTTAPRYRQVARVRMW
jgi:quercetin dioxygenase-like cupin family protein